MNPDKILTKTPVCIRPVFRTVSPNEPILVYRGPLSFEQGAVSGQGEGEIRLDWLPRPAIRFELNQTDEDQWSFRLELERITLKLPDTTELAATINYLGANALGLVEGGTKGGPCEVRSLKFSVPNFGDYIGLPIRGEEGGG